MTKETAKLINPITLAFLGDAVYSLRIREKLIARKSGTPSEMQRIASKLVSARGQSAFLTQVLPLLTEEEAEIYRRGRNAKKTTKSKNADAVDYNRSTGFEAVLGYLYLIGAEERIEQILSLLSEEDFEGQAVAGPFKPNH